MMNRIAPRPRRALLRFALGLVPLCVSPALAQSDTVPESAPEPRPAAASLAPWAGAAAALGGAVLLDRGVADAIPEGGGNHWHWASRRLNYLGRPQYAAVALGATWLGGRVAGSSPLSRAALHTGLALAVSGVANGTLKTAVGRERPSFTSDPGRFRPLNLQDRWQSFPSGHATVVFSLAASISEEARRPWVSVASYGTAALVGWSRVYDGRHWTSDVVGGALVGALTSRMVIHRLHARENASGRTAAAAVALVPLPGGMAVSLSH